MHVVEIKEIISNQLQSYQLFFREGLIADETSFRITPADDENAPFPTRDKPDSFTLGAYLDEQLLGVVSFARDGADREKLRHKGILFRMYVSNAARGKGVAGKLIDEVIQRVRLLGDIEQINLTVIADNAIAKLLYQKKGFITYSTEPRAIKWKGKYFTEDSMVYYL